MYALAASDQQESHSKLPDNRSKLSHGVAPQFSQAPLLSNPFYFNLKLSQYQFREVHQRGAPPSRYYPSLGIRLCWCSCSGPHRRWSCSALTLQCSCTCLRRRCWCTLHRRRYWCSGLRLRRRYLLQPPRLAALVFSLGVFGLSAAALPLGSPPALIVASQDLHSTTLFGDLVLFSVLNISSEL